MGRADRRAAVETLDLLLWSLTEVLKLRSLHFGYWREGDEVEMAVQCLREAQTRYTEELIRAIPAGMRSVLDIGCGVGDNALALAERGYAVTAISPDSNHRQYFERLRHERIRFYSARLEDFAPGETFDLLLMSESQNFFDADVGFQRSRQLLAPQGYLLVCGLFRRAGRTGLHRIRHSDDGYIAAAAARRFELLEAVDITANVLPTVELIGRAYREYAVPVLGMMRRYLEHGAPMPLRLARLLCARQLRRLETALEYHEGFTEPAFFERNACYLRLLFRPGEAVSART